MQVTAEREMLTLLWGLQSSLVEHYLPSETAVTISWYCDICDVLWNRPRPGISSKHCGVLSSSILLQHDNARTHIVHLTAEAVKGTYYECLSHPPHLSDLTPLGHSRRFLVEKFLI
jgi:hypothetical protein